MLIFCCMPLSIPGIVLSALASQTDGVALLNRGTPSSLAGADGTLHIGLMRASSAWPAGDRNQSPRRVAGPSG